MAINALLASNFAPVFETIFEYLGASDIGRLALVSKRLNSIVREYLVSYNIISLKHTTFILFFSAREQKCEFEGRPTENFA